MPTDFSFDYEVPLPVCFCSWKHHLKYIVDNIPAFEERVTDAQQLLESINGTLLDMYVGNLTPNEIAGEVVNHSLLRKHLTKDSFTYWISQNGTNYRCLTLSDESRWVLRLGYFPDRFIHIHPGRNSVNTFRFRSSNLRVAIAYRLLFGWNQTNYSSSLLNRARCFVKLTPLGGTIESKGTVKILNYLNVKNF